MTHDELLAKIYDSTNGLKYEDIFLLLIDNTNALRAVVELCRDYAGAYQSASEEFENGLTVAFALVIQTIEKELE